MNTMSQYDPTYKFEGDKVFAIYAGQVIAHGKAAELDKVESDAVAYLDGLKTEDAEKKKKNATHIVTPNGIKGKIITRIAGVWGDEITVRLENGEVTSFGSHAVGHWVNEKTASAANPVEGLQTRLAASFEKTRPALIARYKDLKGISEEARSLIPMTASYGDQSKLDEIRIVADAEAEGVAQAIDHIDSGNVEAYVPPTPVAVGQADLGHSDSWIETVVQEMIDESENNDFDQIMAEDPEVLVAGLDDGAVADQGATREVALSHVVGKTAGFVGEDVEDYRDRFLARVEQVRRRELTSRTTHTRKEAATTESKVADAPDEALFG